MLPWNGLTRLVVPSLTSSLLFLSELVNGKLVRFDFSIVLPWNMGCARLGCHNPIVTTPRVMTALLIRSRIHLLSFAGHTGPIPRSSAYASFAFPLVWS